MKVTALLLKVDGTEEIFEYDNSVSDGGLSVLQEKVGGWIENAVVNDPQLTMYCNEEGKILGLPINQRATDLLHPSNLDVIVGDVVLVGPPDGEGNDTSVPQAFILAART